MNLAIITAEQSDLSRLIQQAEGEALAVQYIRPGEIEQYDLDLYEAFCILGGTQREPLLLSAKSRIQLEEQLSKGKKVFGEYIRSLGLVYTDKPQSTRFKRLIYAGGQEFDLEEGDLLEDQCNEYLSLSFSAPEARPILIYRDFIEAHGKTQVTAADLREKNRWGLWKEQENLILCAFRLSNFEKARFAPKTRWDAVVQWICAWLTGLEEDRFQPGRVYSLGAPGEPDEETRREKGIDRAIRWFDRAGMLIHSGRDGVYEGFGTEIEPDGRQRMAGDIRNDCCGEVSMAMFAQYLRTGNPIWLEKSDNLENFCFQCFQVQEGPYAGMFRWTETAWGTCYQDDVARVLIPALLKMLYTGGRDRMEAVERGLDFLLKTTGADGLRISRTDLVSLDEGTMEAMRSEPTGFVSAHHNAFYLGALLLCGKMTDNAAYVNAGVMGLEAIMAAYPKTIREQSETEELCRLIMPLAWLYWATGDSRHRDWLYQVDEDLQRFCHDSGAYLEWDSDYSANCSRTQNAECSVQAYLVTGDERFYDRWKGICSFMLDAQLISKDARLDGAWTRGVDVELMEVYGLPNDIGWGPWAIETGWTVAEIAAGMGFGCQVQRLKEFYTDRIGG